MRAHKPKPVNTLPKTVTPPPMAAPAAAPTKPKYDRSHHLGKYLHKKKK